MKSYFKIILLPALALCLFLQQASVWAGENRDNRHSSAASGLSNSQDDNREPKPQTPPLDGSKPEGILQRFGQRVKQAALSDTYDLYIPINTWHNRLTYDQDKIDSYNEMPWGVGLGKSIKDEDGDLHALYGMGFADSHKQFQPMLGYAYIKNWYPAKDLALGVGYTIGITARHEYDYIPIPLPLPLVSAEYKNLALQAAYIPGTYNNGNVLFTWLRWSFHFGNHE